MKISIGQKKSWLFACGMIMILSAITYSYIEQTAGFLIIAVALVGAFLSFLSFIYKRNSEFKTTSGFAWNKVALFGIVALFSIVFLVSVNYFSQQLPYRWDVTKYSQHTLTEATIDFIENIKVTADDPIEMTAFYVGLSPKYLQDLLSEYERISNGKIVTKIVDPIEDIAYAAKFGNVINGEESKLIVVYGDERKDIDFSTASLSENKLTNALASITREPRSVYFLSGHGELTISNENNTGLSLFAELLKSNNMSSKNLMLGTERKIPDDCDVLIIAGPRNALNKEEQGLLSAYLERGGDALFLVEAITLSHSEDALELNEIADIPSMNSLLNKWGIHIGNDVVVDLSSHIGGDQGSPATRNYGKHKAITDGLDYTFYIRPRSISLLSDRRPSIQLAPIAYSASKDQSWAETNRSLKIRFDEGVDIAGPVAMSYVIWEGKEKDEASDTRIIVFTDADFLSNAYLNQYSNAAMGLNVVNWLSELDYAVFHDPVNIKVERLDLTSKQRRMVTALLFLMPLLIGLIGVFVWLRSK